MAQRKNTQRAKQVFRVVQNHELHEGAEGPLGKIVNHCRDAHFDQREMKEALHLAGKIAKAYNGSSTDALYVIAEAMERYVVRFKAGTFDVGNMSALARAEAQVRRQGPPVLAGLSQRVDEHLLGIDDSNTGNYGIRKRKNSPLATGTFGKTMRYKQRYTNNSRRHRSTKPF